MLLLIILSIFITTVLVLFSVLKYAVFRQKSIFRLKRYINYEEIYEEKKAAKSRKELWAGFNIITKGISSVKFLDGYKKSVQIQLTRAHVLLKPEEYITVCLIISTVSGAVIFLMSASFLYAMGMWIIGWLIPSMFLNSKIKKRVKLLNEQLGEAIVLISNSIKSGYSFFQAVDVVTKEMTGPISEEFALLQKEINLGLTTEKALENLVNRSKNDNLELVVTAVMIQRQVGGNLAEVLDNIYSTIRERVKIKGEIKTITAQGRMSGLVISLLPPGLGVILYVINPEHIGLLFKTSLGLAIIGFSILMELLGIYFINKIVKIEI